MKKTIAAITLVLSATATATADTYRIDSIGSNAPLPINYPVYARWTPVLQLDVPVVTTPVATAPACPPG